MPQTVIFPLACARYLRSFDIWGPSCLAFWAKDAHLLLIGRNYEYNFSGIRACSSSKRVRSDELAWSVAEQ